MVEYVFAMKSGKEYRFSVDVDRALKPTTLPILDPAVDTAPDRPGLPFWTELAYHRCPNCPLSPAEHKTCPPAQDLQGILEQFAEIMSIDVADVRVITPEREFSKRTDTQTALQSLVGLVMATGSCPHLAKLRPQARTHLPFATTEETVYRAAAAHLLREYFAWKDGRAPDLGLEGLRALYAELQTLNYAFSARIRAAAKRDASLNALSLLFSLSVLVSASLDEDLKKIRPLFT